MNEETTNSLKEQLVRIETRLLRVEELESIPRGSNIGNWFAILVSAIAIIIGCWSAYKAHMAKKSVNYFETVMLDRIAEFSLNSENLKAGMENTQKDLLDRLALVNDKVASGEEGVRALKTEISKELMLVQGRIGTSPQDWLYAEAEYLIRMANQRALMGEDLEIPLRLLQSAVEVIREIDDAALHALSKALERDIDLLKANPSADVQRIYLEISSLSSQVSSLKLNAPTSLVPLPKTASKVDASSAVKSLLEFVYMVGGKLSHLIDFRRRETEIRPIMLPKEEYFLRHNLLMKLQVAQIAILERKNIVYQGALREAQTWISNSFDLEDPVTTSMLESLNQLIETNISNKTTSLGGRANSLWSLEEIKKAQTR